MTATVGLEPYQRVVAATALSNLADGIRYVALPLLTLQLTKDPLLVSTVIAASQAPWLVFGLWAGGITDRSDRREIARRTALARVALLSLLGVLIVADTVPVILLIVVAFVLGTSEVLADNVNSTLIPSLVDDNDLERANSRMVGAEILGNELIGPAIGGLLFTAAASLPFFTNAGLLAVTFLLLSGLPLLHTPHTNHDTDTAKPRLLDGVHAIWSSPTLRTLTWSSAVLAAIDGAWFTLLALVITVELAMPAAAFGVFLAIGAAGGLAGAAVAARLPGLSLPAVAGTSFAAMAVPLIALAWFTNPVVVAVALVMTSGAFSLWNVFMVSARQRASTPGTLGRIGAAYRTIVVSAGLIGTLAGGALAQLLSIRATLEVSAIAVCVATPVAIGQFRRHEPSS